MPKAYKASNPYKKANDTAISKQDFITGLITYGQRITKTLTKTSTTLGTIYTVPLGKTFFMVSAYLQVWNDLSIFNSASVYIGKRDKGNLIEFYVYGAHTEEVQSIPFTIPIKINAGESIFLQMDQVDGQVIGIITGYEVDTAAVPNFT